MRTTSEQPLSLDTIDRCRLLTVGNLTFPASGHRKRKALEAVRLRRVVSRFIHGAGNCSFAASFSTARPASGARRLRRVALQAVVR